VSEGIQDGILEELQIGIVLSYREKNQALIIKKGMTFL
jgi:hypothetical protein